MGIVTLIIFGICVFLFIRYWRQAEEKAKDEILEDDDNKPDFKPFLDSRIGGTEEEEEEESTSYDDFLEY